MEHGVVVFFDLQPGLKLAIWKREDIAYEANESQSPASSTEFTIGHHVKRKKEVHLVMEQATKAGARITDPPHETFYGGYSGHLQDPDGHLWEVV